MTLGQFLLILLIAGICGSIAQALAGGGRGGCLVSIALGLVGAIVGTWLAHQLRMQEFLAISIGGQSFPIIWTIIGAALFAGLLNLFRSRR
jgi:uncharacterized membrane protein YeaQ/YmgE (transglycosylase-associated protein family)